jgi:dipeptide/tripeptide permease
MIIAGAAMTALLVLLALTWRWHAIPAYWGALLVSWCLMGMAYAASITPGGRLLRRSADSEDRTALFAAQFALSHVCWLIAYPMVGQVGAHVGFDAAFGAAAILAGAGVAIAVMIWPEDDPEIVPHVHDDLPADHPHLLEAHRGGDTQHVFQIDDLHPRWPR